MTWGVCAQATSSSHGGVLKGLALSGQVRRVEAAALLRLTELRVLRMIGYCDVAAMGDLSVLELSFFNLRWLQLRRVKWPGASLVLKVTP
jgi:hypothetical protein